MSAWVTSILLLHSLLSDIRTRESVTVHNNDIIWYARRNLFSLLLHPVPVCQLFHESISYEHQSTKLENFFAESVTAP